MKTRLSAILLFVINSKTAYYCCMPSFLDQKFKGITAAVRTRRHTACTDISTCSDETGRSMQTNGKTHFPPESGSRGETQGTHGFKPVITNNMWNNSVWFGGSRAWQRAHSSPVQGPCCKIPTQEVDFYKWMLHKPLSIIVKCQIFYFFFFIITRLVRMSIKPAAAFKVCWWKSRWMFRVSLTSVWHRTEHVTSDGLLLSDSHPLNKVFISTILYNCLKSQYCHMH